MHCEVLGSYESRSTYVDGSCLAALLDALTVVAAGVYNFAVFALDMFLGLFAGQLAYRRICWIDCDLDVLEEPLGQQLLELET